MKKATAILLALIFCVSSLCAFQNNETITARRRAASGGSTPTVVQNSPNVTGGGASATCTVFTTNPSTTCTFGSNLGASHYLLVSEISGTVTSFTTPTGSGAGCPSTWTVVGTSTTTAAVYISSVTSSGACTVTIAASSAGGVNLQGHIRELSNVITTIDVSSIGANRTFCTSCNLVTLTTTVANDLVVCDAIAGGGPGTMAVTSPFTADINTSGGLPQIGGYNVQAVAGAGHMNFTSSSGSAFEANCIAVEP